VEAPGVAPFFSCGSCTLDNLLTLVDNLLPRWLLCNKNLEHIWLGTLLKIPPIIRPERMVLLASLYFTFCLYSKMIQLGKFTPFFVIKNVLDIKI